MLEGMGIDTVEVRTPADLEGCDGLILPGGESTTQLQFLQEEGLYETIKHLPPTVTPSSALARAQFFSPLMCKILNRILLDCWT